MAEQSLRTQAFGSEFALASPHYLASYYGFEEYLTSADAVSSAMATMLSLYINQPHLCGVGGDLVTLVRTEGGSVFCHNGTGKTGTGHELERIVKHIGGIPRRGWASAMVYGAPAGIESIARFHHLDLVRLGRRLARDAGKGIIRTPSWMRFLGHHSSEVYRDGDARNWLATIESGSVGTTAPNPTGELLQHLCLDGFDNLYRGEVGDKIAQAARRASDGVFVEEDFRSFAAEPGLVHRTDFRGASIAMFGNNGPWLELSALLRDIERIVQESATLPSFVNMAERISKAIGFIDHEIDALGGRFGHITQGARESIVEEVAGRLSRFACDEAIPAQGRGSDTVFLAVANSNGTVIGATGSIFTPFGAFVDPAEMGLLLSNRAFSFDLNSRSWRRLRPQHTAPHTVNCLIVECSDMVFSLGVTGGPVQSQVLAQMLYRIVCLRQDPQFALEQPRIANIGSRGNQDQTIIISEPGVTFPGAKELTRLSEALGIAQMAGYSKSSRACFAASDPRGEGVALAI